MHAHAHLLQSDPPEILDLLEWFYWYIYAGLCENHEHCIYMYRGEHCVYDLLLIWDLMYKNNYNNNGKL